MLEMMPNIADYLDVSVGLDANFDLMKSTRTSLGMIFSGDFSFGLAEKKDKFRGSRGLLLCLPAAKEEEKKGSSWSRTKEKKPVVKR
jgi:hypothetical protein